jgi:homoserine kinase
MSLSSPTIESKIDAEKIRAGRAVEVRVPASTSNLGSGFDCCGLALKLYLSVTARVLAGVIEASEGTRTLDGDNLIFSAMRFVADRENAQLPPVHLEIRPDIPFASGLGSSAAAIAAGITLCSAICDLNLDQEKILSYGTELEGHADNFAAALLGGLVFTCTKEDGEVIAVKRVWPSEIKLIAVTPHCSVQTKHAREILSVEVSRQDAVYNLQRIALLGAALETKNYGLLWEAMKDRLHQKRRAQLVPGLAEVLALPREPGLLGLALSGSGPTVVALATENFDEISDRIVGCFRQQKLGATVRRLEVDFEGTTSKYPC